MKKTYKYKLFRITKFNKPSTISMDLLLATLAIKHLGSQQLKRIIHEQVALWHQQTNPTNCSSFVSAQVRAIIANSHLSPPKSTP